MPLLVPTSWPDTPGFETAPLRWRSDHPNVAVYAVEAEPGRLSFLLIESRRELEDQIAELVRCSTLGKRLLPAAPPAEIVEKLGAAEPRCAATAARWEGDRLLLAAREAPVPFLLRFGRPVPFELSERDGVREVTLETGRGDLLVVCSSGLSTLESGGKPPAPENGIVRLARAAETQALTAAFAALVSEWKKVGIAPGKRDVLLLAAKRL